LANKVV